MTLELGEVVEGAPQEPSERARPCDTPTSDFWLPELGENLFLLFEAPPVGGPWSWEPQETNTGGWGQTSYLPNPLRALQGGGSELTGPPPAHRCWAGRSLSHRARWGSRSLSGRPHPAAAGVRLSGNRAAPVIKDPR